MDNGIAKCRKLVSAPVLASSPMAIVRTFKTTERWFPAVYFTPHLVELSSRVQNPSVFVEKLQPVWSAVKENMGENHFFISMLPEFFLDFRDSAIPEVLAVPQFKAAFLPISEVLLAAGVENDCAIELDISTGRRDTQGQGQRLGIKLSVWEVLPGHSRRKELRVPVSLDLEGEHCQSIFDWFTGSYGGLVSWRWSRQLLESHL